MSRPLVLVGIGALGALMCLLTVRRGNNPQEEHVDSGRQRIRVITYNVQFLPGLAAAFNRRPDAGYRLGRIAEEIARYDVIGLCEVFDGESRRQLIEHAASRIGPGFEVVVPESADRSVFGIDSGLVLLTRFPVLESHHLRFGNDSSILRYGIFADGFANKGVLHARIMTRPQTEGGVIDVFLTHLESQDAARREQQYRLLAEFIRTHADDSHPVLLMGDLNTVGDEAVREAPRSQYQMMFATLREVRPDCADLGAKAPVAGGTSNPELPDGGPRIDYILLSNSSAQEQLRAIRYDTQRFADPQVEFLSDHAAVIAELQWLNE